MQEICDNNADENTFCMKFFFYDKMQMEDVIEGKSVLVMRTADRAARTAGTFSYFPSHTPVSPGYVW